MWRGASVTTPTRWGLATLALLAVAWVDARFGHGAGLAVLVGLLVLVAVFGGHGRPGAPRDDGL